MRRGNMGFLATALIVLPVLVDARPALDGDADGVPDERDACLYSPRGIVVGPSGCSTPGDEDEDGVPEARDACPQSPAGARVDAQGCALDGDIDGVADGVDACPGSRLGLVVDARGCGAGERAQALPVRPLPPPPPPPPQVARAVAAPSAAQAVTKPSVVPSRPAAPAVVATTPAARAPQPVAKIPEGATAIGFAPYSAVLDAAAEAALQRFVADSTRALLADPDAKVRVVGGVEADETGAAALQLAESRAATVQARLTVLGLPRNRIERAQDRQSGARRVELRLVPG